MGLREKTVLKMFTFWKCMCPSDIGGSRWNMIHCKGNGCTVTFAVSLVLDMMKM